MRGLVRRSGHGLVAVASLAFFVLMWEVLVRLLHVRPIMLPPPSTVFMELWAERGWYLGHAWYTLLTTLAGFALAVVVGALVARGMLQAASGAVQARLVPRIEERAQDELYTGLADVELAAFDDADFTALVRRAAAHERLPGHGGAGAVAERAGAGAVLQRRIRTSHGRDVWYLDAKAAKLT